MTILDEILEVKKLEVANLLKVDALSEFTKTPSDSPSLFDTLYNTQYLQVISEIKRASPSKGLINGHVNPIQQALAYEKAGAAAISVLTDQQFFKGSMDDLQAVSSAVNLPVLCKDFIIHPLQIDQAKRAGASVILLIVAALEQPLLHELFEYASKLNLEVLVEVHDVEELQRALAIDAKIIGINNRNLKTFEVDLANTAQIAASFPFHEQRVLISESGIADVSDATSVARVGAHAVLVGETLMRSENIDEILHTFHVKRGEC